MDELKTAKDWIAIIEECNQKKDYGGYNLK